MNNSFKVLIYIGLVCVFNVSGITVDTLGTLPDGINFENGEKPISYFQFRDCQGIHILVLLRSFYKSEEGVEKIILKAIQFKKDSSQWKQEWKLWDFIECENLDIHGEFLKDLTSITDLDKNKIFETTVAYQMICAGDVSPKTTKVIMRQGDVKYAVRGESLVAIGPDAKYGGTFEPDTALDRLPKFKVFLIEKWKIAAGIK